ncbi:MAG TPA: IPT/TIG domain-containing protein [Minicystis sp.]|nr:IPT/TIG domain-containing protein [Minicystis sp.]
MRLPSRAVVACSAALTAGLAACIASAPSGLRRETDPGDAGTGGVLFVDAGPPDPVPDAGDDPHGVIGADPPHGPFSGGQRVLVRGRGFTSAPRVWFGDVEVDAASVLPIDPSRVQVGAPPGKAGAVDVSVQDGDDASTRRTLAGGYTYDALYAQPNEGPVSGGTVIQVIGQGTHFGAGTTVDVDMKACTGLTVQSKTALTCTVPKGTPGSKSVRVTTGGEQIVVLDAFTYEDSDNGYKGGLSGAPLAGHMKVLVYDNYTGDPIPDANVILGAPIESAIVAHTDDAGVAVVNDASLAQPTTLTVTGYCHSPQTFVAVPVDTATIYLDPILTPLCGGSGMPPPVGGKSGPEGTMSGQLVWPMMNEFQRGNWQNVPAPKGPNERKIAYVMTPAYDPTYPLALPSDVYAVTPDSPGSPGFEFSVTEYAGTQSFYALAGIEDTARGKFVAYAMGVVRGVPIRPDQETSDVYIQMDHTLDQVVTLDVTGPTPGPRGPDRLATSVAVRLGAEGFLVFSASDQTPLLPFSGPLPFVGLPPLDGSLAGQSYVTSAKAVTGPGGGTPTSVVAQIATSSASQHVPVDGFIGVPVLTTPAPGAAWDGQHLAASAAAGGPPPDVTVFDVVTGNAVAHWLVAVPGAPTGTIDLPDISGFAMSSLPPGPITVQVTRGAVAGFDYANLEYRALRTYGMTAYAQDDFSAHL